MFNKIYIKITVLLIILFISNRLKSNHECQIVENAIRKSKKVMKFFILTIRLD